MCRRLKPARRHSRRGQAVPPVNLGLGKSTTSVITRHPRAIARAGPNNQISFLPEIALQHTRYEHARIRIEYRLQTLTLAPSISAISSRSGTCRKTRRSKFGCAKAILRRANRICGRSANRNFIRTVSPSAGTVSSAGRRQAGAAWESCSADTRRFARSSR
jgi:hypothetical protein